MVSSVKVIHGPNNDIFDLPNGTTVFNIRRNLADAFNIPRHASPFVNGDQVPEDYRLRKEDTLEFVVSNGRKGSSGLDDFLTAVVKHFPVETWSEDSTALKQNLLLEASTYRQTPLFDLPPVQADKFSQDFLVSSSGAFAYQNRVLSKGHSLELFGVHNGMVAFNGDVVIPSLIDMTVDSRSGERFPKSTSRAQRAKWGAVWMSLTPSEMLTQRPGVRRAQGTVLIGGLGLGWMLERVCQKVSVERVILVERSQELLDWYGYDLCKRFPKVSAVICDDVYNQIGRHGESTMHLLDIWLRFLDSSRDPRLLAARRKLKKRVWAWGQL